MPPRLISLQANKAMATFFGNSLDQIGQGYANPSAGPGQSWQPPMSLMQGQGDFGSQLRGWATQLMQNNQAGGGPPPNPPATGGGVGQTGNWMQDTGPMAGNAGPPATGASLAGNFGQPPNPPAGNATTGAPAGGASSPTL